MLASILDHSCTPNCVAIFNGRQLQVMAMQRILPGLITTTATISYISPMEDTQTREQQQRRIWHFSCSCSLCTSEQGNLVDRQKHSLACSSEGCEGGRPILLEGEEFKDKVCTDVVEVEERSEDSEDAEVVELAEDSDDAAVKVENGTVEIVEVDNSDSGSQENAEIVELDNSGGQENADDRVEMTSSMAFTGALPCWQCGEASEDREQV